MSALENAIQALRLIDNQADLNELAKQWKLQMSYICLLYTSPSPRDVEESRMPSSA